MQEIQVETEPSPRYNIKPVIRKTSASKLHCLAHLRNSRSLTSIKPPIDKDTTNRVPGSNNITPSITTLIPFKKREPWFQYEKFSNFSSSHSLLNNSSFQSLELNNVYYYPRISNTKKSTSFKSLSSSTGNLARPTLIFNEFDDQDAQSDLNNLYVNDHMNESESAYNLLDITDKIIRKQSSSQSQISSNMINKINQSLRDEEDDTTESESIKEDKWIRNLKRAQPKFDIKTQINKKWVKDIRKEEEKRLQEFQKKMKQRIPESNQPDNQKNYCNDMFPRNFF